MVALDGAVVNELERHPELGPGANRQIPCNNAVTAQYLTVNKLYLQIIQHMVLLGSCKIFGVHMS